jgi:hypothetical protein
MTMKSVVSDPRIISMRCRVAEPGAAYPWHHHPFDEFTLVTEDTTLIGYAAGERPTQPNTLLLYHRGERHGAWNSPKQAPRYWVVHFTARAGLYRVADRLAEKDPRRRAWQLTQDQVETFKWLFLQILNERLQQRTQFVLAESAWLRLLLLSVQRWAAGETIPTPTREGVNPDLLNLWHLVNASAEKPAEALRRIHSLPNYDSLRHAFTKAFGCSPREMMARLRMQHAKNLLLESGLSVKEIAARCGYGRQHEFARAFHEQVGVPPSQWRAHPFSSPDSESAT